MQDDLVGIDLLNGCRNTTFNQNVTFAYQGLPSLTKSSASQLEFRNNIFNLSGMIALVVLSTMLL